MADARIVFLVTILIEEREKVYLIPLVISIIHKRMAFIMLLLNGICRMYSDKIEHSIIYPPIFKIVEQLVIIDESTRDIISSLIGAL